MNLSDTARVLTRIAAIDQRTIGKSDVAAWHETIGHLDLKDCLEAVRRFHAAHAERRILPADIITGVQTIRGERLHRTIEPAPEDPDNVEGYLAQLRTDRTHIATAPPDAPAIASHHHRGGPPPQDVRSDLDRARAACLAASAGRTQNSSQPLTETEQAARARATRERARPRTGDPDRVTPADLRHALPTRQPNQEGTEQ